MRLVHIPSMAMRHESGRSIAFVRTLGERLILLIVLVALMLLATGAHASSQRTFASPQEAVDALVQAVQSQDPAAVLAVIGPAQPWLFSGDRVADRARGKRFVEVYKAKHSIAVDGDTATLLVGTDDYPFAFPLVRNGTLWRFDTEAGKDQLLARRIGENELHAIQTLRAIVDAQLEYASQDRNGDGVVEYARTFGSRPGKHDGLYWPVKEGEPPSPLGSLLARASAEGYKKAKDGPTPYHGYLYRMLEGLGRTGAPDAVDFVVKGRAIGGFAVVAYPAKYGNTGIMTFAVTHQGEVYEADLGPQSGTVGAAMQRLELGPAWKKVPARN